MSAVFAACAAFSVDLREAGRIDVFGKGFEMEECAVDVVGHREGCCVARGEWIGGHAISVCNDVDREKVMIDGHCGVRCAA